MWQHGIPHSSALGNIICSRSLRIPSVVDNVQPPYHFNKYPVSPFFVRRDKMSIYCTIIRSMQSMPTGMYPFPPPPPNASVSSIDSVLITPNSTYHPGTAATNAQALRGTTLDTANARHMVNLTRGRLPSSPHTPSFLMPLLEPLLPSCTWPCEDLQNFSGPSRHTFIYKLTVSIGK